MYVGSADGTVYALDDGNGGAVAWRYATGGPVGSTPTTTSGNVVVGSDDGSVYLLDATTGRLYDSATVGGRIRTEPAVVGNATFLGRWDGRVVTLASLIV